MDPAPWGALRDEKRALSRKGKPDARNQVSGHGVGDGCSGFEAARPSRDARDLSTYSSDYYMIIYKRRLRHGWLSGSLHGNTLGDVAVLAVSNSTPSAVTAMVCSYCAERLPSLVTAVHPSGHVTSL